MDSSLYVSFIGLLTCLFSFSGYEGGAHMAEETTNASKSAPRGIIMTCVMTGLTGFVYFLGLLYACNDQIDNIITPPATAAASSTSASVNVFVQAFTNNQGVYNQAGAVAMTALLVVNLFFAGFSSLTVTSRIGFAMARDGALPAGKILSKVNNFNQAPNSMIILVFFLDALFCLLPLINPAAFAAITSITTIGYQISYAIPILMRVTVARKTFVKSSFDLGRMGIPLGWVSVIWLTCTSCFFIFPTSFDANMQQTPALFNYTCVVVVFVIVIAVIYWFFPIWGARHHFTGPKRQSGDVQGEIQVANTDRGTEMVDIKLQNGNKKQVDQLESL